jgi:hypothetical protein
MAMTMTIRYIIHMAYVYHISHVYTYTRHTYTCNTRSTHAESALCVHMMCICYSGKYLGLKQICASAMVYSAYPVSGGSAHMRVLTTDLRFVFSSKKVQFGFVFSLCIIMRSIIRSAHHARSCPNHIGLTMNRTLREKLRLGTCQNQLPERRYGALSAYVVLRH